MIQESPIVLKLNMMKEEFERSVYSKGEQCSSSKYDDHHGENEHKTISVTGISIGGGNIQVTELNGFAISLNMNTPTIIIVHQDVPGMIAHVTEALPAMISISPK